MKTGYYYAIQKANNIERVIFFNNEFDTVHLCGIESPFELNDFDIICEVEPPAKTNHQLMIKEI
jgi:hypothetical protein